MPRFMLLCISGPGPLPSRSAEENAAVVAEYTTWHEKMAADGRLCETARLTDTYSDPGRTCTMRGDEFVATEGPLAGDAEVVGGYAIIEATDYDEAIALCRNHPAARDGRLGIRQVF